MNDEGEKIIERILENILKNTKTEKIKETHELIHSLVVEYNASLTPFVNEMIHLKNILSNDQKGEESTRIASDLWNLGMAHSDHKLYGDYKKLLDRINSQDEKFAVTCLLKLSLIIDSYTWQNPPTFKRPNNN